MNNFAVASTVARRSNDNSGGDPGVDTYQITYYNYDRLGRLHQEDKPIVTYGGTDYYFSTLNYYDNNGGVVKVINRKIEDGEPPVITDRFVINEYFPDKVRLFGIEYVISYAAGLVGETQNTCDKAGAKFTMPYVHLATMLYCLAEYADCMIQCQSIFSIKKKLTCQWCCLTYRIRCVECVRR